MLRATRLPSRSKGGIPNCNSGSVAFCFEADSPEGDLVAAGRISRSDDIPAPSKLKPGQHGISVPLYLAPKLALYLAMRERRMPNTELAKLLGVSETVVRRMLNPKHDTRPERIQAALVALGKRIVVTFEDAA